tara:strand:- start:677 stop:817 length:141 start_codon:yes stop_codon:yes gene_type:complete
MKNTAEQQARLDIYNEYLPYEGWDVSISYLFTTINRRLNKELTTVK